MPLKKILLIDDSNFSRDSLKRALGSQYQFLEANNGLSGIEIYSNEKPDLVILDLTMPDLNGMEVLDALLQKDPTAHVVIGSADIQIFTRQQAAEKGAAGFISKPFTPETVNNMVQAVLEAQHESNSG